MHNMRSYAMRGAVPVLFAAHLLILAVTRQVSALNPALRIPSNVVCHSPHQSNRLIFQANEYGAPI
jgi:hypothetical protein